jgi:DNA-binding winged helix-turn-helix (wHTH) protein
MVDEQMAFGPFCLSFSRRELLKNGVAVQLGARAFELLAALVRRSGNIVSKDELLAEVWAGTIVEENNLQVQISALRKALGDGPEGSRYVLTVPGRGYRFVGLVERAVEQASSSRLPQQTPPLSGPSLPLPDKPSIAVLRSST